MLWLEDTPPQKLRRYGTIHPQADAVLGPPIERLIELMLAIDGAASGKREMIHLWQDASEGSPEAWGKKTAGYATLDVKNRA